MLRRNIRDYYQHFSLSQEQKDAVLNYLLENRIKSTDLKGKKWRAKGQWASRTVILIILAMLLCGAYRLADQYGLVDLASQKLSEFSVYVKEQLLAPPTEPALEPDQPREVITPDIYAEITGRYVAAISEDWDAERCAQEDISTLISTLDSTENLYYCVEDLDDNFVRELLITDGNVIYDLYTWQNQELQHVFSAAERYSLRLTETGVLLNTDSNGESSTIYTFYRYSSGYLIVDQMVVFDSQKDPENPWFRGFSVDSLEPITELAAREILDSYRKVSLIGSPIEQYE